VLADPGTTWENIIDDATVRFQVLDQFGGAAVLDKETGRVWERSPGMFIPQNWFDTVGLCSSRVIGPRWGWRLPTIEELASLLDTARSDPALPPGHPFTVPSGTYWSATSTSNGTNAWRVDFGNGDVASVGKSGTNAVWCVRGGQGIEGR
jgi:uncharacterized protein DUF1566